VRTRKVAAERAVVCRGRRRQLRRSRLRSSSSAESDMPPH